MAEKKRAVGGRARHVVRDDAFLRRAMGLYGRTVFGLALLHTGSRADAEDVCQDVFVALATDDTPFALDAVDPVEAADAREHLKAWLLRATVNRCRDRSRSAWARRIIPLDDGGADGSGERERPPLGAAPDGPATAPADDTALARLEAEELWRVVAQLKPKLREVVYLHYGEEMTCEDIARAVGVGPSAVRMRLQRARRQLKDLLGGLDDEG